MNFYPPALGKGSHFSLGNNNSSSNTVLNNLQGQMQKNMRPGSQGSSVWGSALMSWQCSVAQWARCCWPGAPARGDTLKWPRPSLTSPLPMRNFPGRGGQTLPLDSVVTLWLQPRALDSPASVSQADGDRGHQVQKVSACPSESQRAGLDA